MTTVALGGLVVLTAESQGRNAPPPWVFPRPWGPPLVTVPPIPAPGLDARMIRPAPVGIDDRIIAAAPVGIDERFIVPPRFRVR